MKRLLRYAKQYRLQAVLAPLFKLAEAILELFIPLLVADIIDKGIPGGDWRFIVGRVGLMVGLAAIGLAFSLLAQFFAARTAVGMARAIRKDLFCKVQSLSFAELDKLGIANIINRFNSDCQQVQNGVNMFLRLFLRSPFIVFGAMIAAFTVDSSAWIFAVLIPVLSVAVVGITLWCVPLYRLAQTRLDGVTECVRENLTGVRVVRASAAEEQELTRFDTLHRNLTLMQRHAGRIAVLLNPITYAVVNGGIIALLWMGALRVEQGALQQGEVVALYNYMAQILVELIKLADLIILLTKSTACGKRIADMMEMHSSQTFVEQEVAPFDTPYAVQYCHVGMRYHPEAAESLHDVCLEVPRGTTLGIIGATGSGKSTLVHLLPRFYDATEGQVLVDGVDVMRYPREQLRRKVAVVQQQSVLFDGTLRDNLLFGNPDATDEELLQALQVAQAEDVVAAKGGLDALIREGGHNLSGGQRQRLCIARALVMHPDVLVLDDSSSALDTVTDRRLREALGRLGITTLVVSQRASCVKDAQTIVVLDEGRIIATGTHSDLMEQCPEYREIALLQQGGSL